MNIAQASVYRNKQFENTERGEGKKGRSLMRWNNGKYGNFHELLQSLVPLREQCSLYSSAMSSCGTGQLINNEDLHFCPLAV